MGIEDRSAWQSPDHSVPFNELPVGALFTTSAFYADETLLRQKVDEDRWARLNLDKTAEGGDVIRYGFAGRSSTFRCFQLEWVPMPNVPSDTGPWFMHKLLDATGVSVVGLAT